jgi:hypothetical protein
MDSQNLSDFSHLNNPFGEKGQISRAKWWDYGENYDVKLTSNTNPQGP